MNTETELMYLREHCESQHSQIEILSEHLEAERNENNRLQALTSRLENLVDTKNAQIERLNEITNTILLDQ